MKILHTKLLISLLLIFGYSSIIQAKWGKTGHRVVGKIAEAHLSKKSKKAIQKILGDENLALSSTWADYIRSEPQKYAYTFPWHYVSIPDNEHYRTTPANPKGDIIQAIDLCIRSLNNRKNVSLDSQRFVLRLLVHFVGDLHQPLHVGRFEDKGGNTIKVKWFGKKTNLHTVWDSKIIDNMKLSYTELTKSLNHIKPAQKKVWQNAPISQWVEEGLILRQTVYQSVEKNKDLSYRYIYDYDYIIKQQLLKGGVRLAKILNDIFM